LTGSSRSARLIPELAWQDQAACKGVDTELFFPERYKGVSESIVALCADCPVAPDCLHWAVHHELLGYWAGTSAKRRVTIRRELGIKVRVPLVRAV
jgi:WhiB family redox-sensing transcriptional regulator